MIIRPFPDKWFWFIHTENWSFGLNMTVWSLPLSLAWDDNGWCLSLGPLYVMWEW